MMTIAEALALALQYHQAGQLPPAEQIYRQILQAKPSHPDALHLLGLMAYQVGRPGAAVDLIRQALTSSPSQAAFHNNLGLAYQALGRLAEAQASYREAVRIEPGYAEAHYNLGNVLHAQRKPEEAAASYQQALRCQPGFAQAHNNLGVALADQGQLDPALAHYREALRLRPDYAEAHNNLGNALRKQGHCAAAVASYEQALRLQPDLAEVEYNLGHALQAQGRAAEAAEAYRRALALQPAHPQAENNLGHALQVLGRPDEAIACFRRAIALDANHAAAHFNLGNALLAKQQPQEAIRCYREAIRLQPAYAEAHNNLGAALLGQQRPDEAVPYCREAIRLQPAYAEAHNNLGTALLGQQRPDEAMPCFRQAIALQPAYAGAYNNLGNAFLAKEQPGEAVRCYREAVRLQPDNARGYSNLGNALTAMGQLQEAVASYEQALRLQPDLAAVHSNLLLCLNYAAGVDPAPLFAAHLRWAKQHAEPLAAAIQPPRPDPTPGRRLRVGYVSPDFREHVVGSFIEPVLAAHDRALVETFCYADVPRPDALTERLRGLADAWRSLVGLSDEQAAALVRRDGIDILVDLAGHTANNRMLVFARQPAPAQVSLFGYPNTTGLATMDYRITDAYADPPGTTEAYYTEGLIRLPDIAWCYRPPASPDVNPLPARERGYVTFGAFNNPAKVTPEVLALWCGILAAVAGSRLLLLTGAAGPGRGWVCEQLGQHGIGRDRVELLGKRARDQYWRLFHAADICLDPFPYNGGVTTCDALWMGVPVVSLAGRTYVSRQGVSLLSNLGLHEWVAATPDGYRETAIRWANDRERLHQLRAGLRERMRRSPLLDAERFTRNLEAAYRRIADW